jgi:cell division protein FtsA
MKHPIAVGLDVGTSKVCGVALKLAPTGASILGMGVAASTGLRKGMIMNVDATVDSIRSAVREAESSSGIKIRAVSVGISGAHIQAHASSGATGVRGKEVTEADIDRALDSARAVYFPLEREVLHVIPEEYVLDGQDGIADPSGMAGVRLEARVRIITASIAAVQNLLNCCERAGLEVADIVFGPLASAASSLRQDERDYGVILLDIGGGTTDFALFYEGSLRHSSVFGVGGHHITQDLAVGLKVGLSEAEKIKKTRGTAVVAGAADSEEIEITRSGGQTDKLPRRYIPEIIQPRCEEILELVKDEIEKCSGYDKAVCGVVLTGGTCLLPGFDRLSEAVLGLPVRIGVPLNMEGAKTQIESPVYCTGVGLATYDYEPDTTEAVYAEMMKGVFGRVRNWTKNLLRYTENLKQNNRKEGGILCLKSKK